MTNAHQIQIEDFADSRFQVGQIWNYQTRPTDSKSTLQILKVERLHGTEVAVHIQVNGLNFESVPEKKDDGTASHLPFSEESIEASVTNLITAKYPLPNDYEEGYEVWREAFLEGKAGIFSISVAEVIDLIDDTVPKKN